MGTFVLAGGSVNGDISEDRFVAGFTFFDSRVPPLGIYPKE